MANYPDLCKDTLFADRLLGAGDVVQRPGLDALVTTLVTWYRRAEQRRRLVQLDARMLKDIGLSREQVEAEAGKPFWVA